MTDESTQESEPGAGTPVHRRHRPLRIVGWGLLGVLGALVLIVVLAAVAAAVFPVDVPPSKAEPAADYAEALDMIDALEARDTAEVGYPSIFMGHGSKTETAVVLFHGYTNNPEQFEQLGQAYYDAGYNVLIPRLPGHGMKDTMTKALTDVDTAALVEAADEAIDIAAGLGESVEVAGLSGGGTLSMWAAHNRDEVSSSAPISPYIQPKILPVWIMRPITEITRVIPDIYIWWDPTLKEDHLPAEAYPRYSLKSMSAFLEIGFSIEDGEPQRTSEMDRIVFVSNAADPSINEAYGYGIFKTHLGPLAKEVEFREFDEALGYAHDLVDPRGLNAESIDDIYPELYEWLGITP